MSPPIVYDYLDFRAFLRDWYAARSAADPSFSKRRFVRLAGRTSPGLFGDVVDGDRKIGPDTARAFAKAMSLPREEADFFESLVRFCQATDPVDRRNAWERILATRSFQSLRRIEGHSYAYLARWWIPVVRELAGRKDFDPDPAWIAAHIRPQITEAQAREALATLLELGMLMEDESGVPRPADAVLTTPHEVQSMAVHAYHKGMLGLAVESIDRFPAEERHLLGATLSVPLRLVGALKNELDAVQERLLALADGFDDAPEQVIQIELAMFPLSDRTEGA
ncbi:MAG: TIGR02147 family protein [Alphaproteobacteria bacterium]|nr:TIGR02147 family protein [Alphaproteobacteria bacterium]MCB9699034.1 TIGR02147 family protein [Alphaproteobacteria bacterium]